MGINGDNRNILVFGFLVVAIFFFAEETASFSLSLFGAGFLIIYCLFISRFNLLLLLVFLLPSQRLLVVHDTSVTLLNLIVFIGLIPMMLNYKISRIFLISASLCLLLIVYSLVAVLNTNSLYDLVVAIKFSALVLFVSGFFNRGVSNLNFYACALVYVLGCFVSLIPSYLTFDVNQRLSGAGDSDANILAAYFSFALACVTLLSFGKRLSKFSVLIYSGFFSLFGLLTQSRSFLICIVTIVIFCVIQMIISARNLHVVLLKVIVTSVIIYHALSIAITSFDGFASRLVERVLNPRNDDLSGGRVDLWDAYLEYMYSDGMLFMLGSGGQNAMDNVGVDQAAHNAIIEVFVSVGLFGLIIYTSIIIFLAYLVHSHKVILGKLNPIHVLPLLIVFINGMVGHSFISISSVVTILIGVLAYRSSLRP